MSISTILNNMQMFYALIGFVLIIIGIVNDTIKTRWVQIPVPKNKSLRILCVSGGIVLIIYSCTLSKDVYKKNPIKILSPGLIETNNAYVEGELNFPSDSYSNIDIKIFVNPDDRDERYWLDLNNVKIEKDGTWYQSCRFGNEQLGTNEKFPLDFDIYAIVINKGTKLPSEEYGLNYIDATNEKDFIGKIKPYALAISDKFVIKRRDFPNLAPPIALIVTQPVKPTWGEQVPMHIEVFHKGSPIELKKELYKPGDIIEELIPSPVMYEIKLSREKGCPQSSVWILVENSSKV